MYTRQLTIIIALFLSLGAKAQQMEIDSIIFRFAEKSAVLPPPAVYLHLDKNIYVRNENIWFTAYLVNGEVEKEHTMYVVLTDPMKKRTVLRNQFVMEKFVSQGCIMVPDSLEPGEYRLAAYTNTFLTNPQQQVYQQVISIRAPDKSPVVITDLSKPLAYTDSLTLKYKVTNFEQRPADKQDFVYALYDGNRLADSGRKKTDIWGEATLKLPPVQPGNGEWVMDVKAKYGNETRTSRMPLPLTTPLSVKWFPESGQLVSGRRTRIAFEIFQNNTALATNGSLLANGSPVAKFRSSTAGRGWLFMVPLAGKTYTLQLDGQKEPIPLDFPTVQADGYSVYVENGLPEDTLVAEISGALADSSCFAVLHNYRDIFFSGQLPLPNGAAKIRLPLDAAPRGLTTLTIFNPLGEPVAERAIMPHNRQRLTVKITTDSSQYHTRSKMRIKLQVTDQQGQPAAAFMSVAAVLDRRIDTTRFRDLDRFYYFEQFLPAPAILPGYRFFDNEQQLEELLLTKCWTRYRQAPAPPAAVPPPASTVLSGKVLMLGKPAKKPLQLLLINDGNTNIYLTDSTGHFTLPYEALRGKADSKIILTTIASQKNTELRDYMIVLDNNGIDSLDKHLASVYIPSRPVKEDILSAEEKIKMKSMLREVVVKSRNTSSFSDQFRSKNCNDWICMNNILNCANHPFGSKPQDGVRYQYYGKDSPADHWVTYRACTKDSIANNSWMKKLDATWYTKEFYVADYAKFNAPDPETYTTVFWNPGLVTSDNGELEFSYYTNDLAGRFALIVEGFSEKGLFSGRMFYRVANE